MTEIRGFPGTGQHSDNPDRHSFSGELDVGHLPRRLVFGLCLHSPFGCQPLGIRSTRDRRFGATIVPQRDGAFGLE